MKKLLASLAIGLLFISCRSEDDKSTKNELTSGAWHPYEWGVISGKDGSKIQWDVNDDCEKKTSILFKNDGTVTEHHFQPKANGTCADEGIKNGTYTYNETTKELIINVSNNTYKYKVYALENNELKLDVIANYDMDGDGIDDPHLKVFRKY